MEDNPPSVQRDDHALDESTTSDGNKTGCVIVAGGCLVLLLITAAIGIYVALNWQTIAADVARSTIVKAVNESSLPDDQKVEIENIIGDVVNDFKNEEIDLDDLERILKEAKPLLQAVSGVFAIDQYVRPSGLTPEEKSGAETTIHRFLHGVFEEKIPDTALEELQGYFTAETSPGNYETREPTDDELREALRIAKEKADEADIPEDIGAPNVAEELRKAVSRGYAR